MNNPIYSIVLFILFSVSCQKNTGNSKLIDYGNLEKIEVRLITEIGQSEKYIPGMFAELVLMSDGTMLVSDMNKTTIEQFNAEGEYIATIARKGQGPGELSTHFNLFKGKQNMLIVRQGGMYLRMDFYNRKKGQGAYEYIGSNRMERSNDRYVRLIGALSDSTFLARTGRIISSQQLLNDLNHFNYIKAPIVVTDQFENIIQDSLQIIKIPLPVFLQGDGIVNFDTPPYQYQTRVRVIDNKYYMIARPGFDKVSLTIYDSSHILIKEISFPVKPRPVKQIDLDFSLRNVKNKSMRRALISRVDELKPAFQDIWISEKFIGFQTDINEKGQEIVVFSKAGKPAGRFILPVGVEIQYFINHKLYSLYKNPDTGHKIRIYSIPMLKD